MLKILLQKLFSFTKSSPQKPQMVLDEMWYAQLEKYGSVQIFDYFDIDESDAERQKKLFLKNKIANPYFIYSSINLGQLLECKKGLNSLKSKIKKHERNDLVKKIYIEKIDERLSKIKLIEISINLNQITDQKMADKLSARFKHYSEKIYGKPEKKLFNYAIVKIREKIGKNLETNRMTMESGKELLNLLPYKKMKKINTILEKTSLEKYLAKYLMLGGIAEEISLPKSKSLLNANEIKKYFEVLLTNLELKNWKVIIDEDVLAIKVDHDSKNILIPKSRKMKRGRLRLLMIHEIGVHVRRGVNGENNSLKILGSGLNNYETAEEGIAGICEDISKKNHDISYSSLIGYLGIGLVYGMDDKTRDFRDLYEILQKIYQFKLALGWNKISKIREQKIIAESQELAWQKCIRIFRGTNCQIPGVCFTKDLIYLKGRIEIWQQITNNNPEVLRLFCGKYDPSNPEHVKVLDMIGAV